MLDGNNVADTQLETRPADIDSAAHVDIRPGYVAWTMHNKKAGHVMLVVGVAHDAAGVNLVTVEGNKNQAVRSVVHRIAFSADGKVSGDIVGWGRPPEFGSSAQPADATDAGRDDMIKKHGHDATGTDE